MHGEAVELWSLIVAGGRAGCFGEGDHTCEHLCLWRRYQAVHTEIVHMQVVIFVKLTFNIVGSMITMCCCRRGLQFAHEWGPNSCMS
jgi:hypothetical protein